MNLKHIVLLSVGLSLGLETASACIQISLNMTAPRSDKYQLPADLFKLHEEQSAEPLKLEVPMFGGAKVNMRLGKTKSENTQVDYAGMISRYEADPSNFTSVEERNDYAAALLYAGRFADAVVALERLEKERPGEYATAANLGTAYEMVGEVAKALTWIKEGMARNTKTNEETEWLHVAILETKLELQKDPKWLASHNVMERSQDLSRATKERALVHLLNERLYFIHDNDPVMCDLFFQAALVTDDPVKKNYFLRQFPKFGTIRGEGLAQ